MERRQGRHFTAQEKLAILQEGRQAGATVSEVCRQHQIAATQYYEWEKRAKQGALEALAVRAHNGRPRPTREAALQTEVSHLREVVVALTSENVRLKRGEQLV
jgi:transposase